MSSYAEFLARKTKLVHPVGKQITERDVHEMLHAWQRDVVAWACKQGRAAIFADCGLGVLKCLGTGIRGVRLADVIVTNDDNGKPHVTLSERAAELVEAGTYFDVSMSHEGDYAIGMAVRCGRGDDDE